MSVSNVNQLDPYFTSLISALMVEKRQPADRLAASRDSLNVQLNIYTDLSSKLRELQSAAQALQSTSVYNTFTPGRQVTLANIPTGYTVLSASASSAAAAGQYDVSVTEVAAAQRRLSAEQLSSDQALGKSGDFWLGGSGTASASAAANTTVTGVAVGSVASGQTELGSQSLTLETRTFEGKLQFRLKDGDGHALAVADQAAGGDNYTSDWQTLTAGDFDTKRGLVISLSGTAADAQTSLTYASAGTKITVDAADSLSAIAAKINAASQPQGREIAAAVVGKQLTLTAVNTGTAHTLLYSDQLSGGGLGISAVDQQAALDAKFTVNGISFTRSSNTNLTDVIAGVTLNLAADAKGRSGSVIVAADYSGARAALDQFVSQFNSVQAYLRDKTAITAQSDGTKTTYTRGPLANDSIFKDLQQQLYSLFISEATNTGGFKSLRDIGLTLNNDLTVSIGDESKLSAALNTKFDDTARLLTAAAGSVDSLLSRFTQSSTGLLETSISSYNSQITEANARLADWDERLAAEEQSLISQYANLQAQLLSLTYMQQSWSAIYGSTSSLA